MTNQLTENREPEIDEALAEIFREIPGFSETPVRNFWQRTCVGCETLVIRVEFEDESECEITLCPGKPLQIESTYP